MRGAPNEKLVLKTNPKLPSRGSKICHGVTIVRETAWVVFAARAFIQPHACFTVEGVRCRILNITI
jgi:hypothetical protein